MRVKTLWIREEPLRWILEGRKTIEVRVAYPNLTRLNPGDLLLLNGQHRFVIRRIARYRDFKELLAHEDPASIAPGWTPAQLLEALRALYPPEKEALGVIAMELVPEEGTRGHAGTSGFLGEAPEGASGASDPSGIGAAHPHGSHARPDASGG